MIGATIVVCSVLVLMGSILLYRRAGGEISLLRMNMLSYSFYVLLVFAWFGAVIVTVNRRFLVYDPSDFIGIVDQPAVRYEMWAWLMWMFLALPLGALLVNAVLRVGSSQEMVANYRSRPLIFGISELGLFTGFVLAGVVFLSITAYRTFEARSTLPILNVLTGDTAETLMLRRKFTLSSGFLDEVVDSIFNANLVAWMSYVAYAAAVTTRLGRWWVLFVALFGSSLLLFVLSAAVSPTFVYLAGFLIVRSLLNQKAFRGLEIVGALTLLAMMEFVIKGEEGGALFVLEKAIVGRIMTGQLMGFYMVKQLFPQVLDFIGFASTGNAIHQILGLPSLPSYGVIAMKYYDALGVEQGVAGHMTTNFMGEAWANFGYVGLVVAPLWVGAFVQAINVWFLRRPREIARIGIYAYLATSFGYQTDFISFYYPVGTLFFLLGIVVVLMLARIFSVALGGEPMPKGGPGTPPRSNSNLAKPVSR